MCIRDREEALAGQAEAAEDTVHDEGDTGHVADILEDGQQEEQNEHLGNEAQNSADTGDDAVHDQAVQPASNADALQQAAEGLSLIHILKKLKLTSPVIRPPIW